MIYVTDWSKYTPYFTKKEFTCRYTGACKMEADFMDRLFLLRKTCGFPFVITSGYRAATHPEEAKKEKPGEHYYGRAADIKVYGGRSHKLLKYALETFPRVGVQQKGDTGSRYLHLGTSTLEQGFPSPTTWSY